MIFIIAVGKLKSPYKDLEEDFLKRLRRFVRVIEIEEKGREKESIEMVRRIKRGKVVVCDPRGELVDESFFDKVFDGDWNFLIGGPEGFSNIVYKRADFIISFSRLTFNHQLFRIMLLEQIYRAYCRRKNLPYSKY